MVGVAPVPVVMDPTEEHLAGVRNAAPGDLMSKAATDNFRAELLGQVEESSSWNKHGVEFGSSLVSGIGGTAYWAIAGRCGGGFAGKIVGTALTSGLLRLGVESQLEDIFLDSKEHTTKKEKFLWGVVDGFAGVVGTAAEARASQSYARKLGTDYLGVGISEGLAATAGRKAVENSLEAKFRMNAVRGVTGGAAGGLAWSLPHELYNHGSELDTIEGRSNLTRSVLLGTILGGVAGTVMSTSITALTNARDLSGYAAASLRGDAGLTKVRLLHFNDLHSSLLGDEATLSQLVTKTDQLRLDAKNRGLTALVFDAGDNFSGTPEAGLSEVGYIETRAINEHMQVDAFVPGNHVADRGNAEVDVAGWVGVIDRIGGELKRELPAVAANIEAVDFPGFSGPEGVLYRPYRVLEVKGPNGASERIGVVGLVTEELVLAANRGDLKYIDAQGAANRWIAHLNKPVSEGGEGINKVILLSHLGRNEDLKLAQNVKGVSYVISAHSHDAEPVIVWGKNAATGWDVPVMQAGSQAKWLAQADLTFRADGAADKYRTFGRLHPIDRTIEHHPGTRQFLLDKLGPVAELENVKLDAVVGATFNMDGIRGSEGRQTELGTLICKAMLDGVNRRLPAMNVARAEQGLKPLEQIPIILKLTGEVREALPAGVPSQRQIAKMFLNTGSVERETREMVSVAVTGQELERILNFGLADFPKPIHLKATDSGWPKVTRVLREVFGDYPDEPFHDYRGYFLQTDGLKYRMDLSKPVGARVDGIKVIDPSTGNFVPAESGQTYRVLTYNYPLEQWNKNGIFGAKLQAASEQAARQHVQAEPIRLSQVTLMSEWLERQGTVSPALYLSDNITNITPGRWQPMVRPRPLSVIGAFEAAAQERSKD